MELIDKSAVLAEIDRIQESTMDIHRNFPSSYDEGKFDALTLIENFINTLEVKDVDLEEKATQLSQKYFPDDENIWARPNIEAHKCKSACIEMVEWLKAQDK